MKTILLFRHGKSDWDADFERDHERPLAKRGHKAAVRMGRFLAAAGPQPELILTSTAVRATQTLDLAAEAGSWSGEVRSVAELYLASPPTLLAKIRQVAEDVETVMLVGHEPGWSETIEVLTGGSVRFPTAALARIDVEVERWNAVAEGSGVLQWLVTPKLLKKRIASALQG